MAVVVECFSIKVTQVGHYVMAEFKTPEEALALKNALDDARLAQENPAESQRRTSERLGINPANANFFE